MMVGAFVCCNGLLASTISCLAEHTDQENTDALDLWSARVLSKEVLQLRISCTRIE
jgi:hypothetical protein